MRPCIQPGCGNLTTQSRCPTHTIRRNPQLAKTHLDRIYLRDNTTCHLCGQHVPRHQATLDHLTRLADGGTDREDNLALAHRACNSRKG